MNSKVEILEKLTELKPLLEKEYSVNSIGLFGSFAEGSFNDESDIDLLVSLNKPIGWKFFTLELYLEKVFGRKIDLVTEASLKPGIRDYILKNIIYS